MWRKKRDSSTKVYRLALYGISGSGKTCILAALASPRIANPKGYGCAEVVQVARKGHSKEAGKAQEALEMGQVALNEAKQSIAEGSVPPPTPPLQDPFVYEFNFTTPERPPFKLELIDYSGELLDPAIAPEDLATSLREKLGTMDGILVLAEVFQKVGPDSHKAIDKLLTAFTLLREERTKKVVFEIPIALLLNKWDRISKKMAYQNPEMERKKLEGLFKKYPELPHRRLLDALKNVVLDGDFNKFPVSALGPCEKKLTESGDMLECPRKFDPLNSLGLEDPFIWVAKRRDEIDLRNLESKVSRYGRWVSNIPFGFWRLRRDANSLRSRFHKETDEYSRLRTAVKRSWIWSGLTTALIILAILFGEAAHDRNTLHEHQATMGKQDASDAELRATQKWFEDYNGSWRHWFSRVFLTKAEVKEKLQKLSERREQRAWLAVESEQKLEGKLRALKKYKDEFPEGKHVGVCLSLIKHIEAILEAGKIGKKVRELLDQGKYLAAAELLKNTEDSAPIIKLKESFRNSVLKLALSRVKEMGERGLWSDARKLLAQLEQIPHQLMPRESTMILRKALEEINTSQDKHMYQQVIDYRDEIRCKEYLDKAPVKAMASQVENYLDYLAKNHGRMELTVVLASLSWDNSWNESDNEVTIRLNGRELVRKANVESRSGRSTGELGRNSFEAKLSDEARLSGKVFDKNTLWPDRTMEGEASTTFGSLNGFTLRLTGTKGYENQKCRAIFRLDGIPKEPPLPPWSENQ
jgi:hypothetical protein